MKRTEESGTVIMEAVMIFPMVILRLYLLLTVGNGYYQRSRVEAIVPDGCHKCVCDECG